MEWYSCLHCEAVVPSVFLHDMAVHDMNALYLFTSQTGTSAECRKALARAKQEGLLHAVLSESPDTPMAKEADCFVSLECGREEYPMRTVGYSATVLVLLLIAAAIGKTYAHLEEPRYQALLEAIAAAGERQAKVIEQTNAWLDHNRRNLLRSDLIVFTGSGALYGVALEGAMKVWETLQTASVGYELDEGMHGPNYGYNSRHCVIVLDDGGYAGEKARALARYMKQEFHNGFLIGPDVLDETDLKLDVSEDACCMIDYATVVQVIAWRTAKEQGRDLYRRHDNSVMESYFKSHDSQEN